MEEKAKSINVFTSFGKNLKSIILITVLSGVISGVVSYFLIKPVYQSSTKILVNQKNSESQINTALLKGNVDLINTYSDIIKSPVILDKVITKLHLSESTEELNKNITVNSKEDSQVFTLVVKNHNPEKAVEIANEVSATFQEEIKGIMNVDNVSILAKAQSEKFPVPISPNPLLNIAISITVGFIFGIAIAILMDLLDNTLKDEEDTALQLGLPVLGSIQIMEQINKNKIKALKNKKVGSESIISYGEK